MKKYCSIGRQSIFLFSGYGDSCLDVCQDDDHAGEQDVGRTFDRSRRKYRYRSLHLWSLIICAEKPGVKHHFEGSQKDHSQ